MAGDEHLTAENARCVASEGARTVQVLDSDFVLSIATDELKKCSLRSAPPAQPLVGDRN